MAMTMTMTTKTLLGAVLLAAVTTGCAAPPAAPEPDFSAERIKAHVTFLADDFLEGREAGTRGHEIAARYIASQLELLGVTPGGRDGTYFHTANLLEAARTGRKATLTLTTSGGRRVLENGGDVMIRGPIAGGVVNAKAPMVFVGFGMKDATVGFDDYAGLDVRGKIAVALWDAPKDMDSEIAAYLRSEQRRFAADHGAAALVLIPTILTGRAFPWEQIVGFAGDPQTTWVRDDGTPFDPTNGLPASALIEQKAAASLFDGSPRSLAQILEEADQPGGRPKGFALNTTGEIAVTTEVRRFSSPDVVGVIEGSDAQLKNEYVVLMGHADHIGLKAEGAGDRINNGALDNGAGVATLIEVARAFAMAPQRPRRSILILATTGEEKGLLGAEYFAHYPTVPVERLTAAIDLDMPMLLYDFTDVVAFGAGHSSLGGALQRAGAAMGVTLSPDPMPEQAIFVRSDHYAMAKVGVPGVMLATGMANGGEAAWGKYLSTHYHQPSDDLSQPIVWSAGAKFAELNYRVVRELADADARAQWFAGDYFGNLFAPNDAKAARPAATAN